MQTPKHLVSQFRMVSVKDDPYDGQKPATKKLEIRRESKNGNKIGSKFSIKSSKTQIQLCGFITFISLYACVLKVPGHFECFIHAFVYVRCERVKTP